MGIKTVFTTGEAAKICKVSQQTIIRCFDSGGLKGFRVPGSRFRRIPREHLYAFMKENNIPTDALESGKRKVLVVDDDRDLVELLVDVLERDGRFETRAVNNGFEAGMMVKEYRPDLIILDVMLPDINGVDLCLDGSPAAVNLLLGEVPQLCIIVGGADRHACRHATGEDVTEAVDGRGYKCIEVHDEHQQNDRPDDRPEGDSLTLHVVVCNLEQHHGRDERPSGYGYSCDAAELVGDDTRTQRLQESQDARSRVLAYCDERHDGSDS